MKPAYMPFTYASAETINVFHRLFGPFQILQPLSGDEPEPVARAAESGKVEILTPVVGGEDAVSAALRQFHQWGEIHRGQMDAYKAASEAGFYNETFAAEIRSDILRGDSRKAEADPVAAARLLLCLAQEFDREQTELDLRMKASEARQKKMFDELKGEEQTELSFSERRAEVEPGVRLTENRVLSWLRLAAASPVSPMVLLTCSRSVFDYLMEFAPEAKVVFTHPVPPGEDETFRDAMIRFFSDASRSERPVEHCPKPMLEPETGRNPRTLTIASLSCSSAESLLQALLSGEPDDKGDIRASRNILLGLLQPGRGDCGKIAVP